MTVRVVVVDDHDLVRRSLRRVLERAHGIEVVGEAAGGAEALRRVADLIPDVVLLDVNLPDMGGSACTEDIKRRFPHVQVVAWSGETASAPQMLEAGASGYVLKGEPPERLIHVLRAAASGGTTAT